VMDRILTISTVVAMAFGCASTPPSQELQTARQMMMQSQTGATAELAPDTLREAEVVLNRAEEAHEDSPQSIQERHYAYIAQRRIAIADAEAHMARNARLAEERQEEYQDRLEEANQQRANRLEQTRAELEDVRGELQQQDSELSETRSTLEAREQELMSQEAALAAEMQARMSAEERAAQAEERYQQAMTQLSELAEVREEQNRLVITLSGSVLFETDEAELMQSAQRRLDTVAEALNAQDGSEFVVEGHTDSRGSDSYNEDLSQRRADAVRTYLVSQGVDSNRIRAVGRGESDPVAENDSPEGRANNRRVGIIVNQSDERLSRN